MPVVVLQQAGYQASVTRVGGLVSVAVMKPGDRDGRNLGTQWHEVVRWNDVALSSTVAALHAQFDSMFQFTDTDLAAIRAVVV